MRVYSCCFSPNDPFEVIETQILLLEESLSEAVGRCLIGGDFNSKSPEWGETHLDRRGILVGEMIARNDLTVLNRGKEFPFGRGGGRWSRLAITRCLVPSGGKPRVRCTGGTTSWQPYVANASQRGGNSPGQRGMLCYTSHGNGQKQLQVQAQRKATSMLERLDR